MLSWFVIPAPSEARLQQHSNILAAEGDSDSAFKTPKAARWAGGRTGISGSGSKIQVHFIDVAVVVLRCNSASDAGEGTDWIFLGSLRANSHLPLTLEQFHTLEKKCVFQILYTVELSVPSLFYFCPWTISFEDTLGEDDSINLANNIHFVFISCFCSFIFWCLIW